MVTTMNKNISLWPETDWLEEKHSYRKRPEICRHTGKPYWALARFHGFDPDILFWIDKTNKDLKLEDGAENMFVVDGDLSSMTGRWRYDTSELGKGVRWFKPKIFKDTPGKRPQGHILVRVAWGGDTHGLEYEELKKHALYSKRCVSANGKQGVNWYVFSRSWSMGPMIEETVPAEFIEDDDE